MTYKLAPSVEVRPGSSCLHCGLELTGAVGIVDPDVAGVPHMPSPGDFTVCIGCGNVLAYADDLSLRRLTERELAEVDEDTRIQLVTNARHLLIKRKIFNPSSRGE